MLRRFLLALACGVGLAAPAGAQAPQDCPRGALDARFCKRDDRTVFKSATFPTAGYGMAHSLAPALEERIREAFFSLPWEGSPRVREFGARRAISLPVR
jgi:hypothetical protein